MVVQYFPVVCNQHRACLIVQLSVRLTLTNPDFELPLLLRVGLTYRVGLVTTISSHKPSTPIVWPRDNYYQVMSRPLDNYYAYK